MEKKIGGYREGAGRKRIEGGIRHTWTIPKDIHDLAEEKGTEFLWDAVRFKVTFDQLAEKGKK